MNVDSAALGQLVLHDAEDRPVRVGTLWEAKPAALVFLRHFG